MAEFVSVRPAETAPMIDPNATTAGGGLVAAGNAMRNVAQTVDKFQQRKQQAAAVAASADLEMRLMQAEADQTELMTREQDYNEWQPAMQQRLQELENEFNEQTRSLAPEYRAELRQKYKQTAQKMLLNVRAQSTKREIETHRAKIQNAAETYAKMGNIEKAQSLYKQGVGADLFSQVEADAEIAKLDTLRQNAIVDKSLRTLEDLSAPSQVDAFLETLPKLDNDRQTQLIRAARAKRSQIESQQSRNARNYMQRIELGDFITDSDLIDAVEAEQLTPLDARVINRMQQQSLEAEYQAEQEQIAARQEQVDEQLHEAVVVLDRLPQALGLPRGDAELRVVDVTADGAQQRLVGPLGVRVLVEDAFV